MELTVGGTDNHDDEYAFAAQLQDKVRINSIHGNLSMDGPQIGKLDAVGTQQRNNN